MLIRDVWYGYKGRMTYKGRMLIRSVWKGRMVIRDVCL